MRTLLSFLFLLISFGLSAQKAMSLKEADSMGINTVKLDKLYPPGGSQDSTKAVFLHQQEYKKAYMEMMQNLGKYLKEHGYSWGKPTKGVYKIYFDKRGNIVYFLYRFDPGQLKAEQEAQYKKLLNEFVKTYHFPLKVPKRFSQTGKVLLMDREDEGE